MTEPVRAQLADGRVLEFPAGTDQAVVQATVKKMLTPAESTLESAVKAPLRAQAGAIETGLSLGTGAAGSVLGGLAGLFTGGNADTVRKVQDTLTYQPRTDAGKTMLGAVSYPFEKLAQGADAAGGAVNEAAAKVLPDEVAAGLGAGVNTLIQSAPSLLMRGAGGRGRAALDDATAKQAKLKSQNAVEDTTLADARAAGYKIEPEAAPELLRGLAGKAATRQRLIRENQPVTNSIARKELGLADDAAISPEALKNLRYEAAQPYRDIAALSSESPIFKPPFKSPAETLKELREVRAEANMQWRYANKELKPSEFEKAKKLDAKAELLEKSLEDAATALGRPELIPRLREARVRIAKSHDIENALNKGNGNVDAQVLGNMYDAGKPFSGGMETIAKFDQAFRRFTNEPARMAPPGGSATAAPVAAHLAMTGGSGGGFLAGGIPLLGGPARSLLLSDMYQQPRSYAPSAALRGVSPLFAEGVPAGLAALQGGSNATAPIRRPQRLEDLQR